MRVTFAGTENHRGRLLTLNEIGSRPRAQAVIATAVGNAPTVVGGKT